MSSEKCSKLPSIVRWRLLKTDEIMQVLVTKNIDLFYDLINSHNDMEIVQ